MFTDSPHGTAGAWVQAFSYFIRHALPRHALVLDAINVLTTSPSGGSAAANFALTRQLLTGLDRVASVSYATTPILQPFEYTVTLFYGGNTDQCPIHELARIYRPRLQLRYLKT